MPTFSSKISRMRSVKLPFNGHKKKSESQMAGYIPRPQQEPQSQSQFYVNDTPIVTSPTTNNSIAASFSETLKVISKEAERTQFDDVFNSFFFNDTRCQNRALFMASKLKQSLDSLINPIRPSSSYGAIRELHQSPPLILTPSCSTPSSSAVNKTKVPPSVDSFWRTVTHRLYTLNYILFVLPSDSQSRVNFLNKMEADLATVGDGQEVNRKGGMEAHFALRYALNHRRPRRRKTLLEDAFELEKRNGGNVAGAILPSPPKQDTTKIENIVRQGRLIIEQCLESESKLGHAEKDAMYVFHSIRAGLHGAFEPHIELEEDRSLRHRLKRMVDQNKKPPTYENPFEDEDCIVTEEEVSSMEVKSREADSGFYDGFAISTH